VLYATWKTAWQLNLQSRFSRFTPPRRGKYITMCQAQRLF
jgi:hypothetical protein